MVRLNKHFKEIPLEELPPWFNDQLFTDCLKYEYPDSINLRTNIISVRPAVAPGENYASTIYRVKVEVNDDYKCRLHSFIVKRMINKVEETLNHNDIFGKEVVMYTNILPKFEQIYKSVGENIQFGPKLYKVLEDPEHVLVFDDLNVRNYFVQDRRFGMDIEHAVLYYKKLAQFHAASVVYREKHGEYDSKYFPFVYNEKAGDLIKMVVDGMAQSFVEAIERNEKLCHLTDTIVSIIITLEIV